MWDRSKDRSDIFVFKMTRYVGRWPLSGILHKIRYRKWTWLISKERTAGARLSNDKTELAKFLFPLYDFDPVGLKSLHFYRIFLLPGSSSTLIRPLSYLRFLIFFSWRG